MEKLVRISGIAAPLLRKDIDTDQIIPAHFLIRVSSQGISEGLFAAWRYRGDGTPDPDFILNREPWTRSRIILAGRNFGCGSSREGAPKALREWGIRSIIAPSFGNIFYNNCFRNGILPVELPEEHLRELVDRIVETHDELTVDLETQRVSIPGGPSFSFETPALLRRILLEGLDEIDLTISGHAAAIEAFRRSDRSKRPWSYGGSNTAAEAPKNIPGGSI